MKSRDGADDAARVYLVHVDPDVGSVYRVCVSPVTASGFSLRLLVEFHPGMIVNQSVSL